MNIGVLKKGEVINVTVFADIETAQDFLKSEVWEDADAVHAIPDGFGIGDRFEDGEWIARVIPPEQVPPKPLHEAIAEKLAEIYAACETAIYDGVTVETSVGHKLFRMSDQDQINLLGCRGEITAAMSGQPSQVDLAQGVWYKADGEGETHRFWGIEEFLGIISSAFTHKTKHLTYLDNLKAHVHSLESIDEVAAVHYGMELADKQAKPAKQAKQKGRRIQAGEMD